MDNTVETNTQQKAPSTGFYFAILLFFLIPIIGLIAGLIVFTAQRNDPAKRNFGLACTIWSIVGLILLGAGTYFAYGQIKKYDGYLHEYLGDYGSTVELAKDVISEDADAVLSKIDLNLLIEKLNLKETLKNVDMSAVAGQVDIPALLQSLNINDILQNVDMAELFASVDMNELLKNADIDDVIEYLDLNELLQNADKDELLRTIDLNALLEDVSADELIARIDIDKLLAHIGEENIDVSKLNFSKFDLSNADLSGIDYTTIDWAKFTDAELQDLYQALPLDRLEP